MSKEEKQNTPTPALGIGAESPVRHCGEAFVPDLPQKARRQLPLCNKAMAERPKQFV